MNLRPLTKLVLWAAGLVVALLTGNLSVYMILTLLFVGVGAIGRIRALRHRPPQDRLPPGE